MTKQERIKEAYGEHWNDVKFCVDVNGWVTIHKSEKQFKELENIFDMDKRSDSDQELKFIRPKSLQGIENNNGWIKIESEADLPKMEDDFYVCFEREIVGIRRFDLEHNLFVDDFQIAENKYDQLLKQPTHYQPIEKPQPPIY